MLGAFQRARNPSKFSYTLLLGFDLGRPVKVPRNNWGLKNCREILYPEQGKNSLFAKFPVLTHNF